MEILLICGLIVAVPVLAFVSSRFSIEADIAYMDHWGYEAGCRHALPKSQCPDCRPDTAEVARADGD